MDLATATLAALAPIAGLCGAVAGLIALSRHRAEKAEREALGRRVDVLEGRADRASVEIHGPLSHLAGVLTVQEVQPVELPPQSVRQVFRSKPE